MGYLNVNFYCPHKSLHYSFIILPIYETSKTTFGTVVIASNNNAWSKYCDLA